VRAALAGGGGGMRRAAARDAVEQQLARAEALVLRALRVDADCGDAWSVASRVFAAQGRHEAAAAAANRAIDARERQPLVPAGMLPIVVAPW
jgi:Tfp pilus assembly protein PilF